MTVMMSEGLNIYLRDYYLRGFSVEVVDQSDR
jgi:hypothetical protein